MGTWHYVSIAGSWTRVARVKAEYPNQLDYNGLDEIKKAFVTTKKGYSITGELLNNDQLYTRNSVYGYHV